jgi:signal peptidase I
MPSREPESPRPDPGDDPWADVVAASGYDDAPSGSIYTGRREDPATLRDRQRTGEFTLAEPGPAARRPLSVPPPELIGEELPAAPVPLTRPDEHWANDDDDVVLRAFEEHARSEPAYSRASTAAPGPIRGEPVRGETIDDLLGIGAEDIVEEAMLSPVEGSAPEEEAPSGPLPWDDPFTRPAAPRAGRHEEGWPEPPLPGDPDDDYDFGEPPGYTRVPLDIDEADLEPVEATVMRSRRRRGRTVARELVETLLLALLVFLAVRASFQNFKVDGDSMAPTLHNGEFLIVNKLVYSEVDVEKLSRFLPFLDAGDSPQRHVFHGPERGDIVVLRDPGQPNVDLIKRVIGLPGETIEIVNGTVFIDGQMLEEPYITSEWHYTGRAVTMGSDEYFVMGDNRDNSKDSRSVGPIQEDLIIGKAMLTYWPAGDFGLAPNKSPHVTEKTIEAYREEIATVSAP